MRNYWMRIALGALGIFTVGMIAHSLIHRGLDSVKGVVEGSGPVSIPLAFIPFQLAGDKLGTIDRVTLLRDRPRRVTSVELEVKLSDSVLARGLEGCQLAVNLDSDSDAGSNQTVNIRQGSFGESGFWCATDDSTEADLVEYGHAVLRPGDVRVPLYLPRDLVDELQDLDFDEDSTPPVEEAEADSIVAVPEPPVESEAARRERLVDSLRTEGKRRVDSARGELPRFSDTTRSSR